MEALGFDLESYLTLAQLMRCARNEHCAAYVFQSDASAERARSMHQWRNDWLATDTPLIAYGPDSALHTAAQLDAGADEYLRVPTHGAELAARLRGALRHRIKVHEPEEVRVGGCIIESRTTSLVSDSAKVPLTAREYRVARLLFENAGALVSCDKLAEDVWGLSKELSKRSIEQHIYQLRRKLRACVGDAIVLRSIYGGGYVHEHQGAGTLDTNAFAQHVRALGDSLKPSMNLGERKVPNARQRHPLADMGVTQAASAAGTPGHAQASATTSAALDLFKRNIHGALDAGSAGARRDYQAAGVRMATGAVTVAGGALDTAGLSVAGLPMRIAGPWLAISYAIARGTRREVESQHAGVLQQRHQDELGRVRRDFSVNAGGTPSPHQREAYSGKLLELAQAGNPLALLSLVRDQLRDEQQRAEPGPATQLLSELKMSPSEIQEFADSDESYLKTQLFGPSAPFRYNGDAAALIDKELPQGMPRPHELGR